MRMFSACVYVELAVHLSTELVLRKHSADSMFYDPYRFFTKSVASLLVSVAADISGVVEVNFLQFFFAGENDFICVDDDDVVTSVNMRCLGRFILAGQNFGNAGSQTANSQSCSINDIPFASDVARIGHECCFH